MLWVLSLEPGKGIQGLHVRGQCVSQMLKHETRFVFLRKCFEGSVMNEQTGLIGEVPSRGTDAREPRPESRAGHCVSVYEGGEALAPVLGLTLRQRDRELNLWKVGCSSLQGLCLDRPDSPNTALPPSFMFKAFIWGGIWDCLRSLSGQSVAKGTCPAWLPEELDLVNSILRWGWSPSRGCGLGLAPAHLWSHSGQHDLRVSYGPQGGSTHGGKVSGSWAKLEL